MGKKHKKKKKTQDKKLDPTCNTSNTKNLIAEANTKEDLISRLPDDILCCIISLLPFKSAVKTSFLSTQWKNIWKTNLVRNGTIDDAVITISNFVIDFNDLHRSRNIWGIQFNFHKGNVLLASVSPNRNLHLEFSTEKQEFPRQFGWQLDLNCQRFYLPPPPTFMIKTLHLVSVSYHTNEAVSSLVSNFHFLESLIIAKCNGLRSLQIVGSPKLGNLTIFDCPQLKSLHIKASRLNSFRYRGLLPWFYFEYYRYLDLSDAMFDFRKGPGYRFANRDFDLILHSIGSAKNLTLCRWTFEKLIFPLLPQDRFYYEWYHNFLSVKELWWIDYLKDEELYNSDALIHFLKFCPSLEILSVTIDPKSYQVLSTGTFFPEITRYTWLKHLKVVKLDGFRSQEDEISLAVKLKEVFSAEPKIVATTTTSNGNSLRILVKVSELEEVEDSLCYKFVEEVKHINELCPKHPHMGLRLMYFHSFSFY